MRPARATSPSAPAAAPANRASVMPASADTTTTGRGPPCRRTMVTTRVNAAASATDVPPNLRIVTSLTVVCKARPMTRLVSSSAYVAGAELPLDLGQRRLDLDGRIGVGDRKSTRLNSSHVKISYAVFCLKKKKKKTNTRIFMKKDVGYLSTL